MLVEREETLALSIDPKINWARPSLDVLFESAARVWRETLLCIVLSGANHDGAAGAHLVRQLGGLVIAQDPATAEHPVMPLAAIKQAGVELVLSPADIGRRLLAEGAGRHPGWGLKPSTLSRLNLGVAGVERQ